MENVLQQLAQIMAEWPLWVNYSIMGTISAIALVAFVMGIIKEGKASHLYLLLLAICTFPLMFMIAAVGLLP